MPKNCYTFEKYSVALQYKEGDVRLNGSTVARTDLLKCKVAATVCVPPKERLLILPIVSAYNL